MNAENSPSPSAPVTNYVIEGLFQTQRVHLIVGPSGAGKTLWMLPVVDAWRRGEPVLGRKSNPLPFGYLVCDRPKEDTTMALERIGLSSADFPVVSLMDTNIEPQPESIPKLFPKARVVFVEALAALMNGKMNDYQDVLKFFRRLHLLNTRHDLTIIASVHIPKLKTGEDFIQARDYVMGSGAWSACSNTICLIAPLNPHDVTSSRRKLTIMHRDAQAEVHELDFDSNGRLVLAQELPDWRKPLAAELARVNLGEAFETARVLSWASALGIPVRNAERWLGEVVELGIVERVKKGTYRRPVPC